MDREHGAHIALPALLKRAGLQPRRGLGQNFLVDPTALSRIIDAAELSPADGVVEVGAGVGTLTRPLAERAGRVVAVELDDRLVQILRQRLADLANVQILHGDVLRIPKRELMQPTEDGRGTMRDTCKVVSNLPYYITSAVLRYFLEGRPRPRLMVVTVQREVAERIVAGPGAMSLLAVSVQLYGRPSIVAHIPPHAFYPPPAVESAVVRIDVSEQPRTDVADETAFFRAVRAGFGQRRKTLRNALSAGLGISPVTVEGALLQAGIDARRRAETLSLEEWAVVTRALAS